MFTFEGCWMLFKKKRRKGKKKVEKRDKRGPGRNKRIQKSPFCNHEWKDGSRQDHLDPKTIR